MIAHLLQTGDKFCFGDMDSILKIKEEDSGLSGVHISTETVFTVIEIFYGQITVKASNGLAFSFMDCPVFRIRLNPQTDC